MIDFRKLWNKKLEDSMQRRAEESRKNIELDKQSEEKNEEVKKNIDSLINELRRKNE